MSESFARIVVAEADVIESEVDSWYAACAAVTRTRAKNFWWGIRLLDPAKRRALSAIYAVARLADDIADGDLPAESKLAELQHLRTQIGGSRSDDPVVRALIHAATERPIPLNAFDELIDGCEADVLGRRYLTWEETEEYCTQVAGSVGRLSLAVFGTTDWRQGPDQANALGIGLQLVNIMRDVLEDRRNGRIYLPAAELERHDVTLDLDEHGHLADRPDDLTALYGAVSRLAHGRFAEGRKLLAGLDSRSRWCCGALSGMYFELLHRIDADPIEATRRRVSVPIWGKLAVVGRARLNQSRVPG